MSGSYYYDYCTAANSFFFRVSGFFAFVCMCVLCQAWRRRHHHRRFIFIRTRKEVAPQRFFQFLFFSSPGKSTMEKQAVKKKKISSRCAALVDWCHRRKKLFWNLCESQNKHIPVECGKEKEISLPSTSSRRGNLMTHCYVVSIFKWDGWECVCWLLFFPVNAGT